MTVYVSVYVSLSVCYGFSDGLRYAGESNRHGRITAANRF